MCRTGTGVHSKTISFAGKFLPAPGYMFSYWLVAVRMNEAVYSAVRYMRRMLYPRFKRGCRQQAVFICYWFVTSCVIGCIWYDMIVGGNQSAMMCRHWPDCFYIQSVSRAVHWIGCLLFMSRRVSHYLGWRIQSGEPYCFLPLRVAPWRQQQQWSVIDRVWVIVTQR